MSVTCAFILFVVWASKCSVSMGYGLQLQWTRYLLHAELTTRHEKCLKDIGQREWHTLCLGSWQTQKGDLGVDIRNRQHCQLCLQSEDTTITSIKVVFIRVKRATQCDLITRAIVYWFSAFCELEYSDCGLVGFYVMHSCTWLSYLGETCYLDLENSYQNTRMEAESLYESWCAPRSLTWHTVCGL